MDPLYKPIEAYRCRQGPGISFEIETSIAKKRSVMGSSVARGLASHSRLKHITSIPGVARIGRRQGPGISFEIETRIYVNGHYSNGFGRQGPGISFEIETDSQAQRIQQLEESPGAWHLIRGSEVF